MTFNIDNVFSDIVSELHNNIPWSETDAINSISDKWSEYVDSSLVYTSDIMELWMNKFNCQTHENIDLADYETISDAITASVYYYLVELCDPDSILESFTDTALDKILCAIEAGDIILDDDIYVPDSSDPTDELLQFIYDYLGMVE